ncbi:MAG: hypothetical protein Q7S29_02685 [Candidatus Peribacter sp.]|nr:hypothetical protein [Candidatus Peribacter sp.]
MDKRITSFLAAARSCTLSPVEHAQARAALAAHTLKTTPSAVLRESSAALQLTDYEKAIGRARLLSFMRANPIEERTFSLARMLFRPFTAALSSAMALLLIGGGMAYAAEGSLPGDMLYPIKVHVMEPVISGLALTPARRTQWGIRTIERRLEEADALGRQPDPANRQTILHSQMEQDAVHLQERLRNLPDGERRTAGQNLRTEFNQHEDSLAHMQSTTGVPPALKALVDDADEKSEDWHENDRRTDSSSLSSSRRAQENHDRQQDEEKARLPAITPLPDLRDGESDSSMGRDSDEGEDRASSSASSMHSASSASSGNGKKERHDEQEEGPGAGILPIGIPFSSPAPFPWPREGEGEERSSSSSFASSWSPLLRSSSSSASSRSSRSESEKTESRSSSLSSSERSSEEEEETHR